MNDSLPPYEDAQEPSRPAVPEEAWTQEAQVMESPPAEEVPAVISRPLVVEDAPSGALGITSYSAGDDELDLAAAFEKGYQSPRSARETSRRLIHAHDDKGLLLAASVQPHQLTVELACNCSELTRLVLMQWVRQGEVHKLRQLGEALLNTDDGHLNSETARVMMLLGGLLGILRPQVARRLVDRAAHLLREAVDIELVNDARLWVEAGEVLGSCSPEERVFWNRRLREPGQDWSWNTPESRLALNHLAKVLPRDEGANLEIFQNAVPGFWWDLWRSRPQPAPLPQQPATPLMLGAGAADGAPATRPRGPGFGVGLAAGLAAAVMLAGAAVILVPVEEEVEAASPSAAPSPQPLQASAPEAAPAPAPAPVQEKAPPAEEVAAKPAGPPAPPIRESLRLLQSVLKDSAQPAAKQGVGSAGSPANSGVAGAGSATPPPAPSSFSQKDRRELARDAFEREHPEIGKLFSLLKDGSLRQHEGLLNGESGVAPAGGDEHQNLLIWLILDPPEQADTRLAAVKTAMRELPLDKAVELFELCLYAGSPNEIEIRQCAELLLDLNHESLSQDQTSRLKSLISKKS